MVLGVALFSKLGTDKVFFTFQKKKERGGERKNDDCTRQSVSGLEGLMLLKHEFAPYSRATEMKVKCGSCHSGHIRYLPMNMDGNTSRKSISFFHKVIIIKKNVWCNNCLMFSIFNDPRLQVNKCF